MKGACVDGGAIRAWRRIRLGGTGLSRAEIRIFQSAERIDDERVADCARAGLGRRLLRRCGSRRDQLRRRDRGGGQGDENSTILQVHVFVAVWMDQLTTIVWPAASGNIKRLECLPS